MELGYDMLGLFLSLCCVMSPNRRSALLCCTPLGYVKPVAWISSLSVMTKGKKWAFVSKAQVYTTYAPNTHTYCHYVKIKESELLQKIKKMELPIVPDYHFKDFCIAILIESVSLQSKWQACLLSIIKGSVSVWAGLLDNDNAARCWRLM